MARRTKSISAARYACCAPGHAVGRTPHESFRTTCLSLLVGLSERSVPVCRMREVRIAGLGL